ncbi:family 78 glycoside hydrolase catalytic domain [Coraliomargarita parva]|uniref:family 78 glycoside hydrolase catalytic domain n=1 Tax=Coraliomargarita parva TaxID=3014050 RepID=UPI0022B3274A|nr:family 78 glycoside hydrolase catalytic domain [Coraliomargarita parva]
MLLPTHLRCEALTNPLGITTAEPRLSWIPESAERAQRQTAYQLVASSDPEALADGNFDLWDSGKVESNATLNIHYRGKRLALGDRCWWQVRLWDGDGKVSDWSKPACFGQGPTDAEWQGEWIGDDRARDIKLPPAPFDGANWIWCNGHEPVTGFSCTFIGTIDLPAGAEVEHAEFAVTADNFYRLFFRGEQFALSDEYALPWKRPMIRDFTERLNPGANHFVIQVDHHGKGPAGLLFKLSVRLADGSQHQLVSDGSWKVGTAMIDDYPKHGLDSNWSDCRIVAPYEKSPWGMIRGINNLLPRASYLRTEFKLSKSVAHATLYATALGWHDVYLNGSRAADIYFESGSTDYTKRVYYRAFDVTQILLEGTNCWGVTLADGWYSGYTGWFHLRDLYGKHPRFSGQLHVRYIDGSTETFITDEHWRAGDGPVEEADILMGERYDARKELPGWALPKFDDTFWGAVHTGAEVQPLREPHPGPPVVALRDESFKPVSIHSPEDGVWICDMGQNFAGFARIKVNEPAGTEISLRFAERLKPDGTLYRINLRTARATDTYICKGDGEEIWEPRFTFHGFQYVEISGLSQPPSLDTVTGIPLSSDTPISGRFECSDAMANQLASNVYWSQRSNFIDIPTDCPQRDERMGWTFDAQIFLPSAVLRADVQTFFDKWMVDLDDARDPDGLFPWVAPRVLRAREGGDFWNSCSPGWTDAGVICPWLIYEAYEDKTQLAEHYPQMKALVEWYRKNSRPDLLPPENYACLGDWLNIDAETPKDLIRTAYFARTTEYTAKAARVLGKDQDTKELQALLSDIKYVFNETFVADDGRIAGNTQAAYALALTFGLLNETQVGQAGQHLVEAIEERDGCLSTGFIGTQPLLPALSMVGRHDVAYRLLHNDRFPSWNFSIKNGATTMWERWDGWTPEKGFGDPFMNSFNHYSFGAVYQWMMESIGGIQMLDTAYQEILIAPEPGGHLTHAKVSYASVRGLIQCRWKLEDGHMELDVTIPANTTAILRLPTQDLCMVTESGQAILDATGVQRHPAAPCGQVQLRLESGHYRFNVPTSKTALLEKLPC